MSGPSTGLLVNGGIVASVVISAAVLFVVVETRLDDPLVPMRLLASQGNGSAFVMNMIVSTIILTSLVVGPFYLVFVLGLNEGWVGLIMAVGPVTSALSGIPAGRVTDRFGARRIVVWGLAQAAVGFACFAFLPRVLGVVGYVVALMVIMPGYQMFLAANNTRVMSGAPDGQRGRISGLLGLSRNLGFVTGSSAMPALFAAILGSGDIAAAPVGAIANAFSVTFLAAAGFALSAMVLAILVRETGAEAS